MNSHLRLLLLAGAVIFLLLTLYYIRQKHLDLYHSIRWFALAVLILVMALVPDEMEKLSRIAGIEVPSNLVFLCMIIFLILTCLSLSASVSRHHARIRTLVQQNAIQEERIRELEETVGRLTAKTGTDDTEKL